MQPQLQLPSILYSAPKSSNFGHSTVSPDPVLGWAQTQAFLEERTLFSMSAHSKLKIYHHPTHSDRNLTQLCISEATSLLGEATGANGEFDRSWPVSEAAIEQAIALALKHAPATAQEVPPFWVHLSFDFHWKPHRALDAVETPGNGSYLSVIHDGQRVFLQPKFLFPFETVTPQFRDFIRDTQAHLPFEFEESYFSTLQKAKTGQFPVKRKLPPGWLSQ